MQGTDHVVLTDRASDSRSRSDREHRSRVIRRPRSRWVAFLYIAPAFAFLLLFDLWPILFGFWISLWKWGVRAERFVGLDNYGRVFREEVVQRSYSGAIEPGGVSNALLVTLYYVIGTVPIGLVLAFVVAILLFQNLRARDLIRTIYFLPYVTPVVAGAMVFGWIFNPQVGVANAILRWAGMPPQQWLLDATPALKIVGNGLGIRGVSGIPDALAGPSMALVCVILFAIWSSLGFSVVIFLAGLSNIPGELYEAARLDGATGWQVTRRITLPLLSPTIFFLSIVSIIGAFQAFNSIFVLVGGGGPSDTTETITMYIFKNFYQRPGSTGYAAAVSFILFFILLGLTVAQFRVVERRVHYQ